MDAGEFGVEAGVLEEGVVCAPFDDGALLQHENLVRLTNGAEAVGDHETGATLHQALESFLNQSFGRAVSAERRPIVGTSLKQNKC